MGEASFFDQCPRVTSAMAVTECQAVPVDQRQLNEMFSRHSELAVPMLQYLARTVRMLSGHVDNATLPARQRVARYLLSLFPAGDSSPLFCTHEEIGQAVGLSRVTVSRVLERLARRRGGPAGIPDHRPAGPGPAGAGSGGAAHGREMRTVPGRSAGAAGDCLCHTFSSGALRSAWRRDRLPGWHPYSCGPCPRSRPPCTHRCRTWPSGPGPACRWGHAQGVDVGVTGEEDVVARPRPPPPHRHL